MIKDRIDRRGFTIAATGGLALGLGLGAAHGASAEGRGTGISPGGDAIRQQVSFHASPQRVWVLLTQTATFDKVVRASAAMAGGLDLATAPTAISTEPGGAFSLFGGYITGRQLELIPGERLVQAWRAGSWAAHLYSIVSFALAAEGAGTRMSFDQVGFPKAEAASLAKGWHENYWTPMAKVLAAGGG